MTPQSRLLRAMTLVEVLVCVFVLGLLMTMVATAMVAAYRNYTLSTQKLVSYRNAMNGLDRMTRRLALCRQIYAPAAWSTPLTNNNQAPPTPSVLDLQQAPLVFAYNTYSPVGPFSIAVGYEVVNSQLLEIDYGPPAVPLQEVAQTVLATDVSSLEASPQAPTNYRGWLVVQLNAGLTLRQGPPLTVSDRVGLQTVGVPTP